MGVSVNTEKPNAENSAAPLCYAELESLRDFFCREMEHAYYRVKQNHSEIYRICAEESYFNWKRALELTERAIGRVKA
jgi:hypothetical protein